MSNLANIVNSAVEAVRAKLRAAYCIGMPLTCTNIGKQRVLKYATIKNPSGDPHEFYQQRLAPHIARGIETPVNIAPREELTSKWGVHMMAFYPKLEKIAVVDQLPAYYKHKHGTTKGLEHFVKYVLYHEFGHAIERQLEKIQIKPSATAAYRRDIEKITSKGEGGSKYYSTEHMDEIFTEWSNIQDLVGGRPFKEVDIKAICFIKRKFPSGGRIKWKTDQGYDVTELDYAIQSELIQSFVNCSDIQGTLERLNSMGLNTNLKDRKPEASATTPQPQAQPDAQPQAQPDAPAAPQVGLSTDGLTEIAKANNLKYFGNEAGNSGKGEDGRFRKSSRVYSKAYNFSLNNTVGSIPFGGDKRISPQWKDDNLMVVKIPVPYILGGGAPKINKHLSTSLVQAVNESRAKYGLPLTHVGGFNPKGKKNRFSSHAWGGAVDFDSVVNPFTKDGLMTKTRIRNAIKNKRGYYKRFWHFKNPAGQTYLEHLKESLANDAKALSLYIFVAGPAENNGIANIFEKHGWRWGGRWNSSKKDGMHFEYLPDRVNLPQSMVAENKSYTR